jgi:hypothetical protein
MLCLAIVSPQEISNFQEALVNQRYDNGSLVKHQRYLSFAIEEKRNNSALKPSLWCPDVTICNHKGTILRDSLCTQRWLFYLTSIDKEATSELNTTIMSPLKHIYSLQPYFIGSPGFEAAESMSDLMRFTTKFKPYSKKFIGAFLQNPIDMHEVYLDTQRLFLYTIIGDLSIPLPLNYLNIQNSKLAENHVMTVHINNFLTEKNLYFLKTVFPCSRLIINQQSISHISNKQGSLIGVKSSVTAKLKSILDRMYPLTSFIVGRNKTSTSEYQMKKILQWIGLTHCSLQSNTSANLSD